MTKPSLLVVGLVRNAGRTLAADVQRMQQALAAYAPVQWLLVESDSSDDTLQQLEQLTHSVINFRYLSLGQLRQSLPQRTARIAHCRNAYVDAINQDPRFAAVSHVIVSDFDGLNTRITAQAFASCWATDGWDVCTANQDGPYYDIWALRHPLWSPNDCWAEARFFTVQGVPMRRAVRQHVYARMVRIAPDSPWIEVNSAFGGLAIYKRQCFAEARYIGLNADGSELCEHVALHAQLQAQGYRIQINPRLINAGYTEHTRVLYWWNMAWQDFKHFAKRALRLFSPKAQ